MISFVIGVAENRVIGSHNAIPWYIKEDLKHFKDITTGHTVLMGKNTFDSIINRIGKPLPNRKNVVVSRDPKFSPPEGVYVYHSLEDALQACKDDGEIMVAGGGQIYSQLMDKADKLYLTEVHKVIDGDVLFPEFDKSQWKEISREDHEEYSFVTYER
ncbi:MAG: dihydrofolate reductase [Candidatus Doudnabacteria bacterium]|nr:dihydrofolate reductase [Candidatus Doudnabacteria bacterium]